MGRSSISVALGPKDLILPMVDPNALGLVDALLAGGLLALPVALSLGMGLGLVLRLLSAFGRAALQLIVLAYLLALTFSLQVAWGSFALLGLLWLLSTQLLSNRIELDGIRPWAGLALLLGLAVTVGYGVLVVLRPVPWFAPQLWVPLGSAVLAQGVSSGAIAANHLHRALQHNRGDIEMHLSLGASPTQASRDHCRAALRAGMLPNVSLVAIAGLGSIPLFFSGLLVSGLDPLGAVLLELLLLLMLLCGSAVTSGIAVLGVQQLSFNADAQLREL
jgi:putative ABC transport system permease protein